MENSSLDDLENSATAGKWLLEENDTQKTLKRL